MKTYILQQRIKTVTSISFIDNLHLGFFTIENIEIRQEFTLESGPIGDFWIATASIKANTWKEASHDFASKLSRIISRISLIGQGYIDSSREPFLITCPEFFPDYGIFRFIIERRHVGLSFLDMEKNALENLMKDKIIPDQFYKYWNDATNTIGYSAKLLLMFSAIEAIDRSRDKKIFPKGGDLSRKILGTVLNKKIFDRNTGLRNRLAHGEYLILSDRTTDYMQLIHQKVIKFFNLKVFKKNLLHENIVGPQRSFYENQEGWFQYIKKTNPLDKSPILLQEAINCFENETKDSPYNTVHGQEFDKINESF